MKTFSIKPSQIEKKWRVIDATGLVVGRLAAAISIILRGKDKPTYTPHMDCGDNVIVINASKVSLTGKKAETKDGKIYYRHTGFPGGIKETTAGKILASKFPERVLQLALKRMMNKGPLGRAQFKNCYIYAGSDHPHVAQQPVVFDFAGKNAKNIKSVK